MTIRCLGCQTIYGNTGGGRLMATWDQWAHRFLREPGQFAVTPCPACGYLYAENVDDDARDDLPPIVR